MNEIDEIKKILEMETKKNKIIVTEFKLFGSILILTKEKYSKPMDKAKK